MKIKRKIALWLDHSKASFITHEPLNEHIQTIYSEHDNNPREDGKGADGTSWNGIGSNNEFHKNQKENEQLNRYYNQLEKLLEDYDELLLFGPTTAKNELYNRLKKNSKFTNKSVQLEKADRLTDPEMLAFVKNYFSKS